MSGRRITKDEVSVLLAAALGQEKSEEVVLQTARTLAIPGTVWSGVEVRAIFARLSEAEGLIGVVARFALSRGDIDKLVGREALSVAIDVVDAVDAIDAIDAIEAPAPSSARLRSVEPRAASVDLLPLLAPALGAEKARDAVQSTALRLGFDPAHLTRDQGLAVLEELARTDGIVGVVARFATARFLLNPS
ncbi:MAG: hypothetical protein KF819_24670 [Labilithrix sp.]|nr:hypothetical protein [Labilithrix sp.]